MLHGNRRPHSEDSNSVESAVTGGLHLPRLIERRFRGCMANPEIPAAALRNLDAFEIEVPSWGFANTGTRFGKFVQAGAATTIEEKFADAAEVHALTGVSPTMALHVEWDLPRGLADVPAVQALESRYGVRAG